VPHTPPRGFTGAPLPAPVWHALLVAPCREATARDMLALHGIHAEFPTHEVSHVRHGKRITRNLPIVTRVVYARFEAAPQWDIMRWRRAITGVYCRGETPIDIPYPVIRAVMGLPTIADELTAARAEMLRVRAGDRAVLSGGSMHGFAVDVTAVSEGRVWFTTLTGMRGTVGAEGVLRSDAN